MSQGKFLGKSQVRHSGVSVMSKPSAIKVRREVMADKFTCPICKEIFTQATSIYLCLHTFCKDCIYGKLQESQVKCCPVCKEDLGSNPEEFLRFDEKLNNIANTIFPPGSILRRNSTSATPQLNSSGPKVSTKAIAPGTGTVPLIIGATPELNNSGPKVTTKAIAPGTGNVPLIIGATPQLTNSRPEVTRKAIAPRTGTAPLDIGAPQGNLNKVDDAGRAAEEKDNPNQTSSNESSSYLPTVPNKMQTSGKMPQVTYIISDSESQEDVYEANTKSKAQSKKKRNKHRKARRSAGEQKKDNEKMESSSVEILSHGFDGVNDDTGEKDDEASSAKKISGQPARKVKPLWFYLGPHQDESGNAFPQLKTSYVYVKDRANLTVNLVQKFVASKLNLRDQSEVDIFCAGKQLSPTMNVDNIIDTWVGGIANRKAKEPEYQQSGVSLAPEDILLKLEYGKSPKAGASKRN